MNEIFLERMRSPEIGNAIKSGKTTVIIPCGAVEQHGPHLPLFMDAEHGTFLGAEVAKRLGNTFVAPTIRVGCSEHHMSFPGTISLQTTTFNAVCRDYCVSLSHHGFRKICMLPSHGGNFKPLDHILDELNDAVKDDCKVVAYTNLIELVKTWKKVVHEENGLGNRVGGPADITVIDPDHQWTIDPERFFCRSRNCPFNGWTGNCRAIATYVAGRPCHMLENARLSNPA